MVAPAWRDRLKTIRPDADHAEAEWWDTSWESGTPAAVGFLIPHGFEAYARIFHPAERNDDAGTSVSWATVAVWVGYGVWPGAWFDAPTTCRPGRESFLFERPLIDVPTLCAEAPDHGRWQSPSAWWPADRAWATSNDTDLDSTLVGGSRALVDELIADDRLEVLRWPVDGSLWAGADEVNR